MNITVTVSIDLFAVGGERHSQQLGFATVLTAIREGLRGPWTVESDPEHRRIAIRQKLPLPEECGDGT